MLHFNRAEIDEKMSDFDGNCGIWKLFVKSVVCPPKIWNLGHFDPNIAHIGDFGDISEFPTKKPADRLADIFQWIDAK